MRMILFGISLILATTAVGYAQTTFERITSALKDFGPDTTAVPDDRTTALINKLRYLGGGFNISEAIQFKLAEDRSKNEITEDQYRKLLSFYGSGNGRRWLDNAMAWIYRTHFTRKELKQLVKFYSRAAGKKMAEQFPVLMLKSMIAAEMIGKKYSG